MDAALTSRETAPFEDERPVLAAVTLNAMADEILSVAGELADGLGAPLVVMHAVHDEPDAPGQYRVDEPEHRTVPMVDVARERLDGLLADVAEQHPRSRSLREARVVLVEGLPAGRIQEIAKREKPRMLVMGSNGRTGLARLVSGSVAEAVTRASHVPVTIVRGDGAAAGA